MKLIADAIESDIIWYIYGHMLKQTFIKSNIMTL